MGQSELLTVVIPLWAILQGASPTQIGTLVGARFDADLLPRHPWRCLDEPARHAPRVDVLCLRERHARRCVPPPAVVSGDGRAADPDRFRLQHGMDRRADRHRRSDRRRSRQDRAVQLLRTHGQCCRAVADGPAVGSRRADAFLLRRRALGLPSLRDRVADSQSAGDFQDRALLLA